MNDLPKLYFTMERYLFPLLEEELGELTAKMREFLRIVEVVRPSRFITSALRWCGLGRPMKDREKMLRAFFLKAVYDFPTTKALIENLKTNPSLRRLCGWESRCEVPSEATSSEEKRLAARIRRRSSSKRSGAGKAKRKKRHWRNRNFPKPKPGVLNSNRIGRLLKTSAI